MFGTASCEKGEGLSTRLGDGVGKPRFSFERSLLTDFALLFFFFFSCGGSAVGDLLANHGTTKALFARARACATSMTQKQGSEKNRSLAAGIPGLDESYLPRWIGIGFGSLILLNHFMPSSPSPAQLVLFYPRSEALGLCLSAFSTTLPYIGKFLKGENTVDRSNLPEGNQQIFIMSDNLLNSQKEDFAWASYVILRNTNTMSVLIMVQEASCVRGYWNMPEDILKVQILELLKKKFEEAGFLDLKDTLYFPERPDFELQQMLPNGTLSLLVQPVSVNSSALDDDRTNIRGFLLLASSANYAYSDKDVAWIRAISNKFLAFFRSATNRNNRVLHKPSPMCTRVRRTKETVAD
ncbi:hypothetical protein KSP39_PZI008332 [Platanthera zijinensis]|uniref:Protein COFACTOR ASSEMBLY OF COMPLEX C SUBUNIT B CCB2, chloroplastic n=1 Tax=Platanthera zijinensis TaxID=2320716 RepID=A0AAP0BN58_9ASPA